jgi:hypothetical protein
VASGIYLAQPIQNALDIFESMRDSSWGVVLPVYSTRLPLSGCDYRQNEISSNGDLTGCSGSARQTLPTTVASMATKSKHYKQKETSLTFTFFSTRAYARCRHE